MNFDKIYPCTVVSDRYSGAYSGAKWLAFNMYNPPSSIFGSDGECMEFWDNPQTENDYMVGKGNTPNEAYSDLLNKFEEIIMMKE